jgi:1,4-alpha-glucan branching enzyme
MRSKFYNLLLTVVISAFSTQAIFAQIITTSPFFPTRRGNVTVTYDASQGNGALAGVSPVYAHTGLITDRSGSAPAVWQYTQGVWGTADPRVLMTSIGNNKWQITYNIAGFYADNSGDTINDLAFVFRNTNGSIVGRTALGGDIFTKVYNDSLHCAFIPGSGSVVQASLLSTKNFFCAASQNCTMTLYANGNQLAQVVNDSFTYNNFTFLNYGDYHLVLTATNGTQTAIDSMDVIVHPPVTQQNPPAGIVEGINYISDSSVVLCLLAPRKNFVYVLGDFNNWQIDTNYLMKQSLNGELWWARIDHLTPQHQYLFQYDVDGAIRIGDPYCDMVRDPGTDQFIPSSVYPNLPPYPTGLTDGITSVLQTAQVPYSWSDTSYHKPSKHNLVIYELLVRDFQSLNDYRKLEDSLTYLQALGINAIELMPIMNFEGTSSWGYDPNYYQAPQKSYGDKNSLKHFINTCHQRGIAVLLDIAFNDAFATCPMAMLYWDPVNQFPSADNPWFNQIAPHPYSVGYDFNHNSVYTQNYLDRTIKYWIQDYHVDGYRFDLAKGYTQTYSGGDVGLWGSYDTMRIRLIERMADQVWNNVDSSAILILEYFANNQEQIELQAHNKGLMLWGYDMNPAYNQITMGYSSNADVSQVSYQYDGWSNPNLVAYMESHDEERLMYKNEQYGDSITGYDTKTIDTACARMECAGALFFPVPGPKMMWMFGERGYDLSINYNGRINPKPAHWDYMKNKYRLHLYKVWAAIIKLKLTYPVFTTTNYNIDMANVVKKMWLVSPGGPNSFNAQVIGNFDVLNQTSPPYFQHTGWWYDYFSGDSFNVTNANMTITLRPGEYHIYTDKSLPVPDTHVSPTLGIDDIAVYSKDHITVYPIPNQGLVHFVSEDGAPIERISIYDIQSRLVYEREMGVEQDAVVKVNLPENINSGMYIYSVTVSGLTHTGKILYTK